MGWAYRRKDRGGFVEVVREDNYEIEGLFKEIPAFAGNRRFGVVNDSL